MKLFKILFWIALVTFLIESAIYLTNLAVTGRSSTFTFVMSICWGVWCIYCFFRWRTEEW